MTMQRKSDKVKNNIHKLATYSADDLSNITTEEIQCLMYELQCHQIELEMQNDELIKGQLELTELNNRLNLIYHQVPIGILTLNNKGFITAANLHLAKMLRTDVNKLINNPLSRFIVKNDLYRFIRSFNNFFAHPENKSIQLSLEGENTGAFPVLIRGTADDGSDIMTGTVDLEKRKLIVVITDISEIKNNFDEDQLEPMTP